MSGAVIDANRAPVLASYTFRANGCDTYNLVPFGCRAVWSIPKNAGVPAIGIVKKGEAPSAPVVELYSKACTVLPKRKLLLRTKAPFPTGLIWPETPSPSKVVRKRESTRSQPRDRKRPNRGPFGKATPPRDYNARRAAGRTGD